MQQAIQRHRHHVFVEPCFDLVQIQRKGHGYVRHREGGARYGVPSHPLTRLVSRARARSHNDNENPI